MENHGTLPFVLRGNRKESRLQLRRSALSVEGGHAGVNGACTQIFLNAEQLVVLGNALGAAGGPVLIWQVFRATARSAMVVSSVSPER